MKVSEALAILNGLDPNQEVTLTLTPVKRKVGTPNGYLPGQLHPWVIGREQWVPRDPNVYPYNTVTCQGNSTVH